VKTLYEHKVEYLEHLLSLRYSVRTIQKRRQALDLFLPWLRNTFQVLTPNQLQKSHLQAWQKDLFGHRTLRGLPLKPSSINSQVGSVRHFLLYLVNRGYIMKSICDALERVKEPSTLPGSVLTHSEVRKLLKCIDTSSPTGYRDRALLEMLYTSGVRATELLDLDVGSIDFEQGTALVNGKGNKQRVVPVGKTALRYLKSYVLGVRSFLLREKTEQSLFLNREGRRFAYHNLRYLLRRCTRNMKLDTRVTPHTFRRSCTTEMVRGGANIYHVKELLGHETLKTMRHYVKLTINDLKKTHEKCHPRERDARS